MAVLKNVQIAISTQLDLENMQIDSTMKLSKNYLLLKKL